MLSLIIGQLLDLSVYGIFAKVLFNKEITNNKWTYIVYTSLIILMYIIWYEYFLVNWRNARMISIILFLFIIADTKIWKKVWVVIFTIALITLIQQFVFMFLGQQMLSQETPTFDLANIIMGVIVLLVAGIIMFLKMKMDMGLKFEEIPFYLYANIVLGVCSSAFPLAVVFKMEHLITFKLELATIIVSYLGLFCSAVTIILFIKNKNERTKYFNESQMNEKLLQLQMGHYEEMVKNYESLRVFKHDINAHLRVLVSLEQNKEYQKLHSYIEGIQDVIRSYNSFYCDNVYITAVINSFYDECKEKNIALDIDYGVHGDITLSSIDVCSLLHNLISNAMEETSKLMTTNKIISLKILNVDTILVIDIANPLSDSFCEDNIQFQYTSKEDKENHGLGLKSIHQIISLYNGDSKYFIKDNQLRINVLLINAVDV